MKDHKILQLFHCKNILTCEIHLFSIKKRTKNKLICQHHHPVEQDLKNRL